MLSGEPGNRLWAGESEWGELEWVSGWDKVLVEEISITYNKRQRRHLSPTQPERPGSFGQQGKTLACGPMLSLEQEASFWGKWGLSQALPHGLPHIKEGKGSTVEDSTPN